MADGVHLMGRMSAAQVIQAHAAAGDSIGGVVSCVCRNVPPGLGEPVFDKIQATFAHAMMSLPAAKGTNMGGRG